MPKLESNKTVLVDIIKIKDVQEEHILKEFQEKVKDLMQDDVTLIRFMRAREYNLEKAEDMLRKSIEWRKENETNSILEWNIPKHVREALPFRSCGYDHGGTPVFYLPLGIWEGRQMVEKGLKHECMKMGQYIVELALTEVTRAGNKPFYTIIALENLSIYQLSHIETMQTLFSGFQDFEQNYPEALKKVIVINAPWLFTMGYNFVKPILSAYTITKIQVFGSNKKQWLPALLQDMPSETIPQEYLQD